MLMPCWRRARTPGYRHNGLRSQAEFLSVMGATAMDGVTEGAVGDGVEAYLSRRRGIEMLTDPGGLGRIQVMAFGRGIETDIMGLGMAFVEAEI